jgi:polyphenol oxidase
MIAPPLKTSFVALQLDWIVPDWPAPEHVCAFSTTRNGGPAGEFDLARVSTGSAAARAALRQWLPEDPLWLRQVHGRAVCDRDTWSFASETPEADAAVTRRPGIVCAVLTADCMPVLLTDRSGGVVAAAHAGWRGLAAGILESVLAAMRTDPRETLAWLGPAIGPRVFEVGADVLAAHCDGDPEAKSCFAPLRAGKWLGDLYALARRRLLHCGVTQVSGGDRCTFTESDVFHSYRRDGQAAGRMATAIWIAPEV